MEDKAELKPRAIGRGTFMPYSEAWISPSSKERKGGESVKLHVYKNKHDFFLYCQEGFLMLKF